MTAPEAVPAMTLNTADQQWLLTTLVAAIRREIVTATHGPRLACVQVTGQPAVYLIGPGLIYHLPNATVVNALRKAHIAHDTITQITQAELDTLKASAAAIAKLGAPDLTGLAAKLDALAAKPVGDVDEAALAQALLEQGFGGLSDADVARISTAANDEAARRGVA